MSARESFRVEVTKDYLKFSAAHFIAYQGFREALHGHNYRVTIRAEGPLTAEGYVVDFGVVKRIARRLCADLDGRMLLPAESDCLTIATEGSVVRVRYEDDTFLFPLSDVKLLPIVHTSVEEIARYLAGCLRGELASEGVHTLRAVEVAVEESFGQSATFRQEF
jgi:6-pyruvoyltetrahydropterin/6-carboxytetrahydropterin synthase